MDEWKNELTDICVYHYLLLFFTGTEHIFIIITFIAKAHLFNSNIALIYLCGIIRPLIVYHFE